MGYLAFIFSQPSDRQSDTPFLSPYETTTYMRFFWAKMRITSEWQVNPSETYKWFTTGDWRNNDADSRSNSILPLEFCGKQILSMLLPIKPISDSGILKDTSEVKGKLWAIKIGFIIMIFFNLLLERVHNGPSHRFWKPFIKLPLIHSIKSLS